MNDKYHIFYLHGKEVMHLSKEDNPCSFPIHTYICAAGRWYIIMNVSMITNDDYTVNHIRYNLIEDNSNDLKPA